MRVILCLFILLFFPITVGAQEMKIAETDTVFGQGEPNPYGKFFRGQTYLKMLVNKDDVWNSSIGNVTFEPGARTNWHKHTGGQLLLVLDGEGRYQERGGDIRVLKKGDVPDKCFTHISVETNFPDNKSIWLEHVSDEDYK